MEPTEQPTELHYFIKFLDIKTGCWEKSTYAMSVETAKEYYGDTLWQIIPGSGVERTVGGDPLSLSLSRFQRKS